MSRSQPSERVPNPSTRWLEWNGSSGDLSYWDKPTKKRIRVALPFTFLLLEEMRTIGGFDPKGNCRIFSNEVRDTTTDPFLVKSFKSGIIAEGIYRRIQPVVEAAGGYFVQSLYIAYRREGSDSYALGNLALDGAALGAWVEFKKVHAGEIYSKAITIRTYSEGKTGNITFRMPQFSLTEVSAAAESAALALDAELQAYLAAYLKRTTHDRVEAQAEDITASDIPF